MVRGLASLELLGDLLREVRVLKNAPSVEWKQDRLDALPAFVRERCVIIPNERRVFPTEGRNRLAEGSNAYAFLLLDDDAYLLELDGIRKGLGILQRDNSVGSIAYAPCDEKGGIIEGFGQARAPMSSIIALFAVSFHVVRSCEAMLITSSAAFRKFSRWHTKRTNFAAPVGSKVFRGLSSWAHGLPYAQHHQ